MEAIIKMQYPSDDGSVYSDFENINYYYTDLCDIINKAIEDNKPLYLWVGKIGEAPNWEENTNHKAKIIGKLIDFYPEEGKIKFEITDWHNYMDFSKVSVGMLAYGHKNSDLIDFIKEHYPEIDTDSWDENMLNHVQIMEIEGFEILNDLHSVAV